MEKWTKTVKGDAADTNGQTRRMAVGRRKRAPFDFDACAFATALTSAVPDVR